MLEPDVNIFQGAVLRNLKFSSQKEKVKYFKSKTELADHRADLRIHGIPENEQAFVYYVRCPDNRIEMIFNKEL